MIWGCGGGSSSLMLVKRVNSIPKLFIFIVSIPEK
jgi:hypothetical protein